MKFHPLELDGVFLVELDRHSDDRGFFSRTYCQTTFREAGLWTDYPQHNISHNAQRGTVRGMHFQRAPHEEVKIVRCTHGAIDDVIVDLREGSKTFGNHLHIELTDVNNHTLYIPAGFAHGFQTLKDHSIVNYHMGAEYHPDSNTGFRWDDPAFDIQWQLPISIISRRDLDYKSFEPTP